MSLIITYVYFQAAEQAASRPGELGYTIALAARYLDFHIQYSINAIRNIRFKNICRIVYVILFLRLCSDNAQRWLLKLNPTLHRGVKQAGKLGARSGSKLKAARNVKSDQELISAENFCRSKYMQCKQLHDSYRFPGLRRRYETAKTIALNQRYSLVNEWMKDVIDERGVEEEKDEYHLHEMKIYNTFQDKINVHELEKWITRLD